jgi:hypothetical protein
MEDVMQQSVAGPAFNALILTVFGSAALMLAVIGIYGVMSYSVEQRTKELGIRLALGAAPGAIQRMVVRQAVWLALAGLVAASGLTRFLSTLLFGDALRSVHLHRRVPGSLCRRGLCRLVPGPALRPRGADHRSTPRVAREGFDSATQNNEPEHELSSEHREV